MNEQQEQLQQRKLSGVIPNAKRVRSSVQGEGEVAMQTDDTRSRPPRTDFQQTSLGNEPKRKRKKRREKNGPDQGPVVIAGEPLLSLAAPKESPHPAPAQLEPRSGGGKPHNVEDHFVKRLSYYHSSSKIARYVHNYASRVYALAPLSICSDSLINDLVHLGVLSNRKVEGHPTHFSVYVLLAWGKLNR